MPPAATLGDKLIGVCTHIVMIPSPAGPIPTPIPDPFQGVIQTNCSTNVLIGGKPAATVGSMANNLPPHIPKGGPFGPPPPTDMGQIIKGSLTVLINNKPAARTGDIGTTCATSVVPAPATVMGTAATVIIGG